MADEQTSATTPVAAPSATPASAAPGGGTPSMAGYTLGAGGSPIQTDATGAVDFTQLTANMMEKYGNLSADPAVQQQTQADNQTTTATPQTPTLTPPVTPPKMLKVAGKYDIPEKQLATVLEAFQGWDGFLKAAKHPDKAWSSIKRWGDEKAQIASQYRKEGEGLKEENQRLRAMIQDAQIAQSRTPANQQIQPQSVQEAAPNGGLLDEDDAVFGEVYKVINAQKKELSAIKTQINTGGQDQIQPVMNMMLDKSVGEMQQRFGNDAVVRAMQTVGFANGVKMTGDGKLDFSGVAPKKAADILSQMSSYANDYQSFSNRDEKAIQVGLSEVPWLADDKELEDIVRVKVWNSVFDYVEQTKTEQNPTGHYPSAEWITQTAKDQAVNIRKTMERAAASQATTRANAPTPLVSSGSGATAQNVGTGVKTPIPLNADGAPDWEAMGRLHEAQGLREVKR